MRRAALIQLSAVVLGFHFYSNLSASLALDVGGGKGAVPTPPPPPRNCTCVDCGREEDPVCGGLWRGLGRRVASDGGGPPPRDREVHVVVSHCRASLDWIPAFFAGRPLASVRVVTKCGRPIEGAGVVATEIAELPNVGRCDHTYAEHLASHLDDDVDPDAIVFFLKDTGLHDLGLKGGRRNSFDAMLEGASSPLGFACAIVPGEKEAFGGDWHDASVYHVTEDLLTFCYPEKTVHVAKAGYEDDGVPFKAPGFANLGDFYDKTLRPLHGPLPGLVPGCYGGIFAASASNVRRVSRDAWGALEASLRRGDNIEEGHFAERLWGALLATPLAPHQAAAVTGRGARSYNARWHQPGMITRKYRCRSVGPDGRTKTDCTLDGDDVEAGDVDAAP